MTKEYLEGLMRSLSEEQIKDIQRHVEEGDCTDYISFKVSVFNAGATVRITFTPDPEYIPLDDWNGYDVTLPTEDVVSLLMRLGIWNPVAEDPEPVKGGLY